MTDDSTNIDPEKLNEINSKSIKNSLFVPDVIYMDLGLFGDLPLGMIFNDVLRFKQDESLFSEISQRISKNVGDIQCRKFDTIGLLFDDLGYNDQWCAEQLRNTIEHDFFFLLAPKTKFLQLLVKHMVRNVNHSGPGDKITVTDGPDGRKLRVTDVSYIINTFPLSLSENTMATLAREIGILIGVNVSFINKNPREFSEEDWKSTLRKVECFYIDSLSSFTYSEMILNHQKNFDFVGKWWFARKRFDGLLIKDFYRGTTFLKNEFEAEISRGTSQLDIMCDFNWISNNDIRLSGDEINHPVT